MLRLLAAAALLLAIPAVAADPIEFVPGPQTTVTDTCMLTDGVVPEPYNEGFRIYYQPVYYGTFDPVPHADGVLLTGGAERHHC